MDRVYVRLRKDRILHLRPNVGLDRHIETSMTLLQNYGGAWLSILFLHLGSGHAGPELGWSIFGGDSMHSSIPISILVFSTQY